jgi:YesN/AraC family two-component response regulator
MTKEKVSKHTVLICDDEENTRSALALFFDKDCEVSFAVDGLEAIDHVAANDVDLVLLDIKMPKLGGIEALREIKKIKPSTKVIMITGWQSQDYIQESSKLGAYDYIVKPFEKIKVQKIIQEALKK